MAKPMTPREYTGLIAAVFTPMKSDCSLNLEVVPAITEYLIRERISGIYVCGTTGEGPSLSSDERREVAEAYVAAAGERIPVIVQVGHNSLAEARGLALHASEIGADAIAAVPPMYFKPESTEVLVDCLHQIASAAPELAFFYYHIPALTGAQVDVIELLRQAESRLPSLVGIKYSAMTVHEFQACLEFAQGRYEILFGCDEMLLSALAVGAYGAVGSTYNFAAPLCYAIVEAFERGDLEEARRSQSLCLSLLSLLCRCRGRPAFKAAMGLLGLDCGPARLPLQTLSPEEIQTMKRDLEGIGFFDWIGRQ